MARSLVRASSQYLNSGSTPVAGLPITIALWVNLTTAGGGGDTDYIASVFGDTSNYVYLGARNSDGHLIIDTAPGGGTVVDSGSAISTGAWHHVCGVFASSTSRSVYLDGGSKVTGTVASNPTFGADISIGRLITLGSITLNGQVAEPAVWSVALTDDEVASLAAGFSPDQIRPSSLVSNWNLFGNDSPERDRRGSINLTVTGSPAKSDHPRIYYRSRASLVRVPLSSAAHFTADAVGSVALVAALSAGATFSAAATGSVALLSDLTIGPLLRGDATGSVTLTAALSTGITLSAGATGTSTTSAAFADLTPIGDVTVLIQSADGCRRVGSLTVHDLLNDAPNTCSFTVLTTAPTVGQEVQITLGNGTVTPDLIFAGRIDSVEQTYEGRPENLAWRVTCQDYTRSLNRRKVRKRYAQQSATAIALDIVANYTSGFTTGGIVAGLPTVTGGIDFTEEDVMTCFTRLASRIGGYAYVDYSKVMHLFLFEATDAPDPLEAGYPFLDQPAIADRVELSQVRTRVYVEGGGSKARNAVAVGATAIPVTDASWYSGSGGIVVSGPQRITYTGKGLAGGPAAPSGSQSLVVGNLGGGPYTYKVALIDAGVESPLSVASAAVSIAAVPDPTTAITAANGSFTPPGSAPTAGTPTVGGAVTAGDHRYAVTFVTASGETTPGPNSSTVTAVAAITAPSAIGTYAGASDDTNSSMSGNGTLQWGYTFKRVSDGAETNISPVISVTASDWTDHYLATALSACSSPPTGYVRQWYRTVVGGSTFKRIPTDGTVISGSAFFQGTEDSGYFFDHCSDGSLGANAPASNGTSLQTTALTAIPTGPSGTTSRKVYRTKASAPTGTLYLVASVSGNVTTTYSDTTADASLGASAPTTNTAGGALGTGGYLWKVTYVTAQGETASNTGQNATITTGSAALSNIPVSADARVTARRIYRTTVGGSTYLFEATINDNTTTTYTSAGLDSALGSVLADVNTTAGGKISLTGIATGGGAVTARKLYRTTSGGSIYKLVTTINDNSTTVYTDNVADASLGVVASGDTISQLTGIPASGPGSVLYDILIDDDVNILEQCDDTAAQTALGILEGGSDGIIEHFIQDRRLASAEARATGNADLALFAYPIVTVTYATRDPKTRSGKTIHVDLPSLGLSGDFVIQSVTIDQIGVTATPTWPRYTVEASSVRFSFADVLRRLQLVA